MIDLCLIASSHHSSFPRDQTGLVRPLVKRAYDNEKIIFLFLNQNICCGYSKEPSQWDGSFEHPKHMLKFMGKKISTILRTKFCLSKPMLSPFLTGDMDWSIHSTREEILNVKYWLSSHSSVQRYVLRRLF